MNKLEREQARDYKLMELINKTEAINNLTLKAEPFIKQYWNMLRLVWQQPVGYNEVDRIKEELNSWELKELNKQYRLLLK